MATNYQLGSFIGTGWGFPMAFSLGGGEVYTASDEQDIFESLEILLGTSLGERVMEEGFGCNLSDYVFEELDQRLLENIRSSIEESIRRYETRIEMEDVSFDIQADYGNSVIHIRIFFRIRRTNSRFNLVYPFYLRETIFGKNIPLLDNFQAQPELNTFNEKPKLIGKIAEPAMMVIEDRKT